MAIIIRFSVREKKPSGTLLDPPTRRIALFDVDRLEDRNRTPLWPKWRYLSCRIVPTTVSRKPSSSDPEAQRQKFREIAGPFTRSARSKAA
jgi:hypothetical protein